MARSLFLLLLVGLGHGSSLAWAIDPDAVAKLVPTVEPAVVTIVVEPDHGGIRVGAGFFPTNDGRLVTSYRLLAGASKAAAILPDHQTYPIEGYVQSDAGCDLIVVRLPGVEDSPVWLPVATVGPAEKTEVVLFAGPELGAGRQVPGEIYALLTSRQVERSVSVEAYRKSGFGQDARWVSATVTAPMRSFHRGGPLVSLNRQVVGVAAQEPILGVSLNLFSESSALRRLLAGPVEFKPLRALHAFAPAKMAPSVARDWVATAEVRGRPMIERLQAYEDWHHLCVSNTRSLQDQLAAFPLASDANREKLGLLTSAVVQNRSAYNSIQPHEEREGDPGSGKTRSYYTKEQIEKREALQYELSLLFQQKRWLDAEREMLDEHQSQLEHNLKIVKDQPIATFGLLALVDVSGSRSATDARPATLLLASWRVDPDYALTERLARGLLLHRLGELDDAATEFDAVAQQGDTTAKAIARAAQGRLSLARDQAAAAADRLTEAMQLAPHDPQVLVLAALAEATRGDYATSVLRLLAARKSGDSPEVERLLALLYATCPDGAVRSGAKAIHHANQCCDDTSQRDWACLLALAAAYAEAGTFDRAVEIARQAEGLAPHADQSQCREHRQLYAQHQPLRITWKSGFQD